MRTGEAVLMADAGASAYDSAVHQLAAWHGEGARPRITIYAVPDPARREVRLIEASAGYPEAYDPEPVLIGPTPDFPYRSGVLSVTREQLRAIRRGQLALPEGWDFTLSRKVWPRDKG